MPGAGAQRRTAFAGPPADDARQSLAATPASMLELGGRLQVAFGNDADFGGAAVGPDRTRFTIRWHGDAPPALADIVDDYAGDGFDIVIEGSQFIPGELLAEAQRLVRDHHPVVQGTGPRPAGDRLTVTLLTEAVQAAGCLQEARTAKGIASDFPLFLEVGDIVPA